MRYNSESLEIKLMISENILLFNALNVNGGTLKCKFKCYVKPIKDLLGVNPSKENQGTTRGKNKILLTSAESNPRPPDEIYRYSCD